MTDRRKGSFGLLRTIGREAWEDDIAGESAKAAYYFFLSLFPAIIALFAFTGILGGQRAFDAIMEYLHEAMPGEAAAYLGRFVQEITGRERPGMLSVGLLLTLWSASNIFGTLTEGLNVVYDIEEGRSWWKRKAISFAAMIVSLTFFALGATAILAGPSIIELFGLPPIWEALRWPLAFLLVTAMLWLIYYLLPNRDQSASAKWTLGGAVTGAVLWTLGTLVFQLYLSHFGSYSKTYGVIGGIMVLLLWLYLTAFSALLGGEVASTLEQRAAGEGEVRTARRESRAPKLARTEARGSRRIDPGTHPRPG